MPEGLSEFREIDGLDDIYTAQKGALRCSAIRLKSGDFCLFSPVAGLGQDSLASLKALGKIAFVLAPNHYHNKGLQEYRDAFPEATLCAPANAQPRLAKITGLKFEDLTRLRNVLLSDMSFVAPEGLKTGEIWVSAGKQAHKTWLVVDAFSGPRGKKSGIAQAPELLGTFARMGVADRAVYLPWLERQIQHDGPVRIVPCHGGVVYSLQLAGRLQKLVGSKL